MHNRASSYQWMHKMGHLGSARPKLCMFILRALVLGSIKPQCWQMQEIWLCQPQFSLNGWTAKMFYHSLLYISALQRLFSCSISAHGAFFKWRSPIVNLAFALIHYHHIVRDGKSWVMLFWGWKNEKHCQIQFPQLCHPTAVRWGEWYRQHSCES